MTTSQTMAIPYGDDGALRTVQRMRQIINDSTANPTVVSFARQLVVTSSPRPQPQLQAARTINVWLRGIWRFVDDPTNRELLTTPDFMLSQYANEGIVAGDCDEAAILGASLGMAIGIPAELTIIGFDDGAGGFFSHVFASLLPQGGLRITLDVTRPLPGTPVPRIMQGVSFLV